ncbi:MAG: hypothetical protein EOP04_07500 [Proteobacteria bacterium]|nr:MAG: hypothetical protein EOP04_07500 [Pseudomonadota bacterium]
MLRIIAALLISFIFTACSDLPSSSEVQIKTFRTEEGPVLTSQSERKDTDRLIDYNEFDETTPDVECDPVAMTRSVEELCSITTEHKLRDQIEMKIPGYDPEIRFMSFDDTRCPQGTYCLWSGGAVAKIKVGSEEMLFESGEVKRMTLTGKNVEFSVQLDMEKFPLEGTLKIIERFECGTR